MLTIFSWPKPFHGHIETIQRNAIHSWVLLRPKCEVILFGDEQGTAEIAAELDIRHISDVECNEYGTPLLSSMFRLAQDTTKHQLMCLANTDIILMSDFLEGVRQVHEQRHRFLIVGQRWDLDLGEPVDFDNVDWEEELRSQVTKHGKLHSPKGIDYFVFPRGLYSDLPPFAIARSAYDNWLVYRTRSMNVPVVDATKAVTVIHQNHDYSHLPMGLAATLAGPEVKRNRELLGGGEHSFGIKHATWMLTTQGLRRALTMQHLYRQLDAVPVLFPRLHFLGIPKRIYIALYKTIRSKLGIARA